ncbi:allantoicase [Georgenia yuyongxinii]|uniref:Probable allantoicase n=1 Tax=Georgenia yuyongxinii TaxID=2589797 RepID=A0A5B8C7E8_9MICO|nr:allantoicase [Georgenia yuyongxinii]QDC25361.1 allantoicase [Georgenia yuyongxinii]
MTGPSHPAPPGASAPTAPGTSAPTAPGAAFTGLTDLASRALGASVVAANDELFASRENLINPGEAAFDPQAFGHKGKLYDGWETRRRRDAGHDWAVVRLGAPGVVRGVVVDTAWFRGNYPPNVSVEAAHVADYPDAAALADAEWTTLVGRTDCAGDAKNYYAVEDPHCWTHVRLSIYPDGGVARFRVHGEALPDPRFLTGTIDLVAADNGGRLEQTSDAFYSSPAQIILPGRARHMGEGWENARRRGGGNDHAVFALAAPGTVRHVEVDTGYYVGNAPGWVRLSVADARGSDLDTAAWTDIVAKRPVVPDTRHRLLVEQAVEGTHVRLDVYPDGGLSRLRLWGEVSASGRALAEDRWRRARP